LHRSRRIKETLTSSVGFRCAQSQHQDQRWSRCVLAEGIQPLHLSAESTVCTLLHASSLQLPAVVYGVSRNETTLIHPVFFLLFPTLLQQIERTKEENAADPPSVSFSVCRTGGEEAMAVPVKTALAVLVLTVASE